MVNYHFLNNINLLNLVNLFQALTTLKSENEYGDAVMETTASLQKKLFLEMKGRIKEEDSDPPNKKGAYFYYERKEVGKNYKIICRKKEDINAQEEIVLHINTLAKGFDYYDLGEYSISPDHSLIAYLYDNNGSERYSLNVKDENYVFVTSESLESNEILYLKADCSKDTPKTLFLRSEGVEYSKGDIGI